MHACLLGLSLLGMAPAADLQTLAGKKIAGEMIGMDRQTVVFKTTGGETIRQPIAELLQIDLGSEAPPRTPWIEVELSDGSILRCLDVNFRGADLDLTLVGGWPLTVPANRVFTILREAQDARVKADWQRFLAQRGRLDMVVVRTDDKLNGLEGVFGPGHGESIEFTPSATGQKRAIRLSRALGFIFNQKPDPAAPPILCKLTDVGGSLLVVAEIAQSEAAMTATTVSGVKFAIPDVKKLARLDFSKGKLTYLSDLEPAKQSMSLATEDDDLFAQFIRYRKDMNLDNGAIRLGGTTHAKGLTLHAGTSLSFEIGGTYREMRAILGVDEGVETESRVEVLIEGDGRELFRGTTSRKLAATPIVLDVKGVRELRLSVRATGLIDLGAQAVFAEAKVSK